MINTYSRDLKREKIDRNWAKAGVIAITILTVLSVVGNNI